MALSAIYRTEERYGQDHIISVLRGESTEKVRRAGHDALNVFGMGADKSKDWWRGAMRQIYALGLTWIDPDRYGAWRLTETARPVLRGEARIEMRKDAVAARRKSRSAESAPKALVDEADEALFTALRALRTRLATEQNVPAYVVFADRTLIDMAARKPTTLDELAECHGVGGKKLSRYGAEFLEVLTGAPPPDEHPTRLKAAMNGDGVLMDALHEAQVALQRGADGTEKPLSCPRPTLAALAAARPGSFDALARVKGMDAQRTERFGLVFLSIIAEHS